MPAVSPPRRPGVRVGVAAPPRDDDLPRMDVAAFVGFAAVGPLHLPVALESVLEFEELFGRDLVLGEGASGPVVAQLAPAVRAFFAGGGRRCWVVRVALTADWPSGQPALAAPADPLPLPGVVEISEPVPGGRRILAAPFLDPRLVACPAGDLLAEFDRLRDYPLQATPVLGLHALLGIPEVTLLALPDAVWVGRTLRPPPTQPAVPPPVIPPAASEGHGPFHPCTATPAPSPPQAPTSPRSASVAGTWRFDPVDASLAAGTLALQRHAIRLCAVRGDLTVALCAPPELRAHDLLRHLAALQREDGEGGIDLTGPAWTRALSFATLHHPWLVTREGPSSAQLRTIAPEGAALGLVARRTLARGVWVAPAWEPLRDALALTPPLTDRDADDLLDARASVLVHDHRGVVPRDALTLSDDPDWTQLSVRRLLILLRRAALVHGERFAFEPLSGALRRGVAHSFEILLGRLFERGAFAGATAAEAFQVAVLPAAPDEAHLVVELRVAPSQPLRFITVRLVQRGDAVVVEEGRRV